MNKDDKKQTIEEDAEEVINDGDETEIETKVEAEEIEVNEWQEKYEETENKYKRALADYQNLEKRVRDERIGLIQGANKELLLRLLPVLDTLFLASQHSSDQSLNISIQLFLDTLKGEGVQKIETNNKEFDPSLMEAVGTEKGKENVVIHEIRLGYMLNEKLLRPAQVIVGKE